MQQSAKKCRCKHANEPPGSLKFGISEVVEILKKDCAPRS
jgi:hypothetical protein